MRRRFYFVRDQHQLPLLHDLEKSPEVLEYYVYPTMIPGSFDGRIRRRPQFLVIEETGIGYVDWFVKYPLHELLYDQACGLYYYQSNVEYVFDERTRNFGT